MSSRRQEELSELLSRVLTLAPIADLKPDIRTRRVHYDWLEAGEHTQRTVAQLSQQLRRFLDDKAWLENRRIMDILHGIEAKALMLREAPPKGDVMDVSATAAEIELPMERPLFTPALKPVIESVLLEIGESNGDASALYSQMVMDKPRISRHIHRALQAQTQVTLKELTESQPLQQGLVELVTYLELGSGPFKTVLDEETFEVVVWQNSEDNKETKQARLPRIIFVR